MEFYTKKFPNVSEEPITSTTSIKPEDGRRHLREYRILHCHNPSHLNSKRQDHALLS